MYSTCLKSSKGTLASFPIMNHLGIYGMERHCTCIVPAYAYLAAAITLSTTNGTGIAVLSLTCLQLCFQLIFPKETIGYAFNPILSRLI
jgi:hypothetical protein